MAITIAKIKTKSGPGFKYKALTRKNGKNLKIKTFARKTDARTWALRIEADHELMEASDKTLYLEISNCAGCLPTIKNTIRVNRMGSQWKIVPISPDRVLINYQGFLDPGGKIPIWLANIMVLKGTMETF